jgi:hypothetical protein
MTHAKNGRGVSGAHLKKTKELRSFSIGVSKAHHTIGSHSWIAVERP